jgi:hypothetical protein
MISDLHHVCHWIQSASRWQLMWTRMVCSKCEAWWNTWNKAWNGHKTVKLACPIFTKCHKFWIDDDQIVSCCEKYVVTHITTHIAIHIATHIATYCYCVALAHWIPLDPTSRLRSASGSTGRQKRAQPEIEPTGPTRCGKNRWKNVQMTGDMWRLG